MPEAVRHRERSCKESLRQAEKVEEGEKERESPWGPIRRSSEDL